LTGVIPMAIGTNWPWWNSFCLNAGAQTGL